MLEPDNAQMARRNDPRRRRLWRHLLHLHYSDHDYARKSTKGSNKLTNIIQLCSSGGEDCLAAVCFHIFLQFRKFSIKVLVLFLFRNLNHLHCSCCRCRLRLGLHFRKLRYFQLPALSSICNKPLVDVNNF